MIFLANLGFEVKQALRMLARQRGFAVAAVATLGFGIGVNVITLSCLRSGLSPNYTFLQPRRIAELSVGVDGRLPAQPTLGHFDVIRIATPALPVMAACFGRFAVVSASRLPEQVVAARVTPGFFKLFGTPAEFGTAPDPIPFGAVVVSDRLWRSQLSQSSSGIGAKLRIDGAEFEVVAVMPDGFRTPCAVGRGETDLWISMPPNTPKQISVAAFGRLQEGAASSLAAQQAGAVLMSSNAFAGRRIEMEVEELGRAQRAEAATALYGLQAVALFILMVACANVAGLYLAVGVSRGREVALRATLGASRARLFALFAVEAALVGVAGGLLAVGFCAVTMPWLGLHLDWLFPSVTALKLQWPDLAASIGAGAATVVVFGLGPAIFFSRERALSFAHSGRATAMPAVTQARRAIVVMQVALSIVVLVGVGLLTHSFLRVVALPLGFRADGLSVAELSWQDPAMTPSGDMAGFTGRLEDVLHDRFRQWPFTVAYSMPYSLKSLSSVWTVIQPGGRLGKRMSADARWVSASYFDTLQVPVRRGTTFRPGDVGMAESDVVVNEQFEALFNAGGSLLGAQLLRSDGVRVTVRGVVGDTRSVHLALPPRAAVYQRLDPSAPAPELAVAVRAPSATQTQIDQILKDTVQAINPDIAVSSFVPMQTRINVWERRRYAYLASLWFLGCTGWFLSTLAIVALTVQLGKARQREFAVRQALGAGPRSVFTVAIATALRPVVLGVVAGVVMAWWGASLWVSDPGFASQLYQTDVRDPATFITTALGVFGFSIVSCALVSVRFTRHVSLALRAE